MSPPLAFFSIWHDAPLEAFEIGEHQFGFDRGDVGQRVDAALDMGDVAVLETAHDVGDCVAFANIGEKLIAEPFAFRGAAHEAGNVDKREPGRNDLLRAGDFRERREARVRHRHVADVGIDGAERIIGRLRGRRLRQRVEERRLADVRQADDAAFEAHGSRGWRGNSALMRGPRAKGKGAARRSR